MSNSDQPNQPTTMIFIHIPKTAGCSFCGAYCRTPNDRRHQKGTLCLQSVRHKRARNLTDEEFDRSVCVVRNPYDRLWSAYNYMRMEKTMFFDNRPGSTNKFPQYDLIRDLTFTEYVTGLYTRKIPFHTMVIPQVAFMLKQGRPCPIILRYEQLHKDIETKLDLDSRKLKWVNKSVPRTSSTHWSKQYTPETRNMVYAMYKKDFIACRYDSTGRPLHTTRTRKPRFKLY